MNEHGFQVLAQKSLYHYQRYAANVSAQPPQAVGMLCVGLSPNCCKSTSIRLFKRSSPKLAVLVSSDATHYQFSLNCFRSFTIPYHFDLCITMRRPRWERVKPSFLNLPLQVFTNSLFAGESKLACIGENQVNCIKRTEELSLSSLVDSPSLS